MAFDFEKPLENTLTGARAAGHRVGGFGRRVGAAARRRPWLAALVVLGVVAAGAGIAVAVGGLPEWAEGLRPAPKDLKALVRQARQHPKDARLQAELGRAWFKRGNRSAGVRAYGRALALDSGAGGRQLATDLASCYGHREQKSAEALIGRYRLVAAEPRLEELARSKHHSVRWGAVRTLEKLGRASKVEYVQAWILDLDAPECDVRRQAAAKLGEAGDRRALAKLRAVKKQEEEETPWYRSRCLGDRADQAEQRILARR
jgi:eukaryotic-like serine/threonine-protein kinase